MKFLGKYLPMYLTVSCANGATYMGQNSIIKFYKNKFQRNNKSFDQVIAPDAWKLGIITPIPKSSTTNDKDPLSYRGITLASVLYKIYCSILNSRLSLLEEDNNLLHDAQNGFRKGRSTVDQITSLTSIIETRKLKRK